METPDRLKAYLADTGRRYPEAWKVVDQFRGVARQEPSCMA